ncbi:MAG: antitoxin VbhA family protein [Treponema sp.]|nr:antitoxin VbhA family protein [Treponema sp.]
MYKPIEVNKEKLTLMGVKFPDLKTLENTAYGIGSNMYEGYEPTPGTISLIRDYVIGKISLQEFVNQVKTGKYA